MYPLWLAAQEQERLRPKSNTNWSHPHTNFFKAIMTLRSALASGNNAKLEKRWNHECAYPLRENPNAPWKEQITKVFKHRVWVVVLYSNHPKYRAPLLVKILNVILYPFKYVPEKSILRMPEYTNYTFRVGSVVHGFSIEFQIPKKFSFSNDPNADQKKKKSDRGKCTKCRFAGGKYGNCTVGTHYAEQGLDKFCVQGELWEAKDGQ